MQETVDAFHKLFYDSYAWNSVFWRGVRTLKNPLDLWVYQEIIHETKPSLIVECGTRFGGSSLFLADMLHRNGNGANGEVVTIDIDSLPDRPNHSRLTYFKCSSIGDEAFNFVRNGPYWPNEKVMVILDSDHSKEHVLKEMQLWGPLVTPGCYMIVEDGNVHGHPVASGHGPGPTEALQEFLPNHPEFEVDKQREKFFMTFNPSGYLRKVK